MSQLYDLATRVDAFLSQSGKSDRERVQIKGQISIKAGLMLAGIGEHTPDEPAKLAALQAAVRAVLGKDL